MREFDSDSVAELEKSVIGAILLDPDRLPLLQSLSLEDFREFKARATWQAILQLDQLRKPIDTATVGDQLQLMGKLDAVGWEYLGICKLKVPTTSNAIEYAGRVKDHALRRRIMLTLGEVLEEAKKDECTGAELLSMSLAGLSKLDAEHPENAKPIGEVVRSRLEQLDGIMKERRDGTRSLSGFPTGVSALDEKLGGWQPGIVSIVAARPGAGKTSLGIATADASSAAGFGVHLFSLEDTESAYADRVIARASGVAAESIRNCELKRGDLGPIQNAVLKAKARRGWLIDGRSGISASEIVRSVRRHKKDNNTKVVIVDYVQLLTKSHPRMSTHEAITDSVQTLADAAKIDNIAYVVMSQLNREIEKREDKRPQLADLRESGSLEERAKCVVGIYRGASYAGSKPKKGIDYNDGEREPSDDEYQRMVQLIAMKNSQGRTGCVRASWSGETMRIE